MRVFLRKNIAETQSFIQSKIIANKSQSLQEAIANDLAIIPELDRYFVNKYLLRICELNFKDFPSFELVTDWLSEGVMQLISNLKYDTRPQPHNILIMLSTRINFEINLLRNFNLPGILFSECTDGLCDAIAVASQKMKKLRLVSFGAGLFEYILRHKHSNIFVSNHLAYEISDTVLMTSAAKEIYNILKPPMLTDSFMSDMNISPLIIAGNSALTNIPKNIAKHLDCNAAPILLLSETTRQKSELETIKGAVRHGVKNIKSCELSPIVALSYHNKLHAGTLDKIHEKLNNLYGPAPEAWEIALNTLSTDVISKYKSHNTLSAINHTQCEYVGH